MRLVLSDTYEPVNLCGSLLLPITLDALDLRPDRFCMEYGSLGRCRKYDLRLRAGMEVNDFAVAWCWRCQAHSKVKRVALDG